MINTKSFEYEDNRLQDIYMHLQNNGFEVYMPSVKAGICVRPYVVVKYDGDVPLLGYSSDVSTYTLLCYVPQQMYSALESFTRQIKTSMLDLKPLFRYIGIATPSYYDDEIKAHMISLQYKNYKKR